MSKGRLILLYCLSGLLFLGCFRFGLLIAEHKPLWNDEIYSQTENIHQRTYAYLFLGRAKEGNNFPLFFVLQKAVCDLSMYQTPDLWHQENVFDRLLLRLNPVFFMSLTVMCIFFYFARFHSPATSLYSLFLTFSSVMIWVYWAEARPYSLWMFLTTIQALYFLYLSQRKEPISCRAWGLLTAIHILLSLTIVFGFAQIAVVSGLLWVLKERNWKRYVLLTLIPMGIAIFYYMRAPHYDFFFHYTPEQLLRDCFSRDRFYILFIFIFFLVVYYSTGKTKFSRLFSSKVLLEGVVCFSLTAFMLLASFGIIAMFKMRAVPYMQSGFPVSSRYFVYLTPIGIISTTLLSTAVLRSLPGNRWVQVLILSGIGYLVIHRSLRVFPLIRDLCAPVFS